MKFDIQKSNQRCLNYRLKILEMSQSVSALHIGGAFSSIEIVDTIYFGIKDKKDTFVMSKGHGCLAQYMVLNKLKVLTDNQIINYCKPGGILGCHPDYGNPGIEASTGSLGHGMGLAVGMAHVSKINSDDNKIFLVLSDGEFQEGSTWECMMMAANLNVKNLVGFLDHNGSQSFGKTIDTHPKFYPIKEKIESFGWETKEVDGHDQKQIIDAYHDRKDEKPLLIICNTTKGKGVKFMENEPVWHYRSPNKEEYQKAIAELNQKK